MGIGGHPSHGTPSCWKDMEAWWAGAGTHITVTRHPTWRWGILNSSHTRLRCCCDWLSVCVCCVFVWVCVNDLTFRTCCMWSWCSASMMRSTYHFNTLIRSLRDTHTHTINSSTLQRQSSVQDDACIFPPVLHLTEYTYPTMPQSCKRR